MDQIGIVIFSMVPVREYSMNLDEEKLRALFLVALMVLSVFAATVAFAGSADAHEGHSENTTTTSPDTSTEHADNASEEDGINDYWFFVIVLIAILLFTPLALRH